MKTSKEADAFIFYDRSEGLAESRKYVENNISDNETREYYSKIISIKYIVDKVFCPFEKLVFSQYFEGLSLKEVLLYHKDNKDLATKRLAKLKNVLANACFKFIIILERPETNTREVLLLSALINFSRMENVECKFPKQKKLNDKFLLFDTTKMDVYQIMKSGLPDAEYFEYIFINYEKYRQFRSRVLL